MLLALSSSAVRAAEAEEESVRGVNPADNITKIEAISKLLVFNDAAGVSLTALTLKYDRAILGRYGLSAELPIARFESPFGSDNGLADPVLKGRIQSQGGRVTWIGGVEAVLPWATADSMGAGKVQLNPSAAVVYPLSRTTFVAGVVKPLFSVAGDDAREDIRQMQLRTLFAYAAPEGWWLLGDSQYWIDDENGRRNEFSFEGEWGRMVGPAVGVWVRGGGHLGGNWQRQDWTFILGMRWIRLAS